RNDTERPVHKVCLDAFYLDKYEASQKLYKKIMGHNPSTLIKDEWPVEHVKFEQARLFCAKQKKRLPTEAEWEYAARAGSREDAPWGDALDSDYVWYAANSMRSPHPVNSKKPNPYGVHNMLGSVWEWVSDWYSPTYYQKSPVKNPKGPLKRKSHHVIRGGSWLDDETQLRVGLRRQGLADATDYYLVGVRCARSLKSGK
ncbi:MAG: SUMF1/EgtB/PvdO family nonheme iron enzyme, partial [Nitrospinaceae bacterium]|nr:formylglycine-generating enzyme family protein [Nitrospinaceae bacterium]NIR57588.1 formylglycine-generating enzyme family protein [Nitrospinaceae bacterium]NIS88058.1 formylglycine-generating enzyme family protein [Nitrospinaceae bacterium]NIT84922.1 formylglycine-generating enzyme family protein [Nitrospinaceae bacterium]NIU47098.1 formylglycine-generating enzyme family protein [Nitrospinaceae bacterium]